MIKSFSNKCVTLRRSAVYGKFYSFLIIFLVALVVSTAVILSVVLTQMKSTTSTTTAGLGTSNLYHSLKTIFDNN